MDREDVPAGRLRAFVSVERVLARLAPPSSGPRVSVRRVASREWLDELVRLPSVRVE
jgi:hypothetical protein